MPSSLVACTRLAGVWVSPEVVLRVLGNVVDMSGCVVDISSGYLISVFLAEGLSSWAESFRLAPGGSVELELEHV